MSYSRWSHSAWYTFWSSSSGDLVEDQVLCLWYSIDQNKDWTWEELRHWQVVDVLENYNNVTEDEAAEAYSYIQQWLQDVEEEYRESNDS